MWQDLKYGARMLAKNPGFTFVAVLSIAIGVGANAAMFSVADTLVLRPLTVPRASEIVTVTGVVPRTGFVSPTSSTLSYPDYVDVRDQARSFSSLMAYRLIVASFADRADQPAQRKFGMAVSGNLFESLGVQTAIGRPVGVEDDRVVGRDPVVVLDNELWAQQFSSDPGVVGRHIRLGGVDMTVIGVLPSGFTGPDQFLHPAFYIPFAMIPSLKSGGTSVELTSRDVRNLVVKGRLKADVPLTEAAEDVRLIGANLERSYPDSNRNHGLTVKTEFAARVEARPPLAVMAIMLTTLAAVVLLVACANVAGLLTSRAPVRAREMALRLAIGAGRPRLIRQQMVESLLIAVGGAGLGLAIGYGVIALFQSLRLPTDVPLNLAFELNPRVLAVGIAVAALSALLSSLVPAWRSTRGDLVATLKNQGAAETRRVRVWGRSLLVCGQVALSLVLLTVAVFLHRAYQAEFGRGPGFRTDHILTAAFEPDLADYDGPRAERFYRLLKERVQALPGVRSVALTSAVPMDQISIESMAIAPEGFDLPAGTENVRVRSARVDEGYFETFGIRLVRGRVFRPGDDERAPRVAVVNETVAEHYWPGGDAIGRRFRLTEGDQPWVEIVGVAANARYRSVSEGPTEFVYYPRMQYATPNSTLLVQTSGDPATIASPLREAVRAIDPNMPIFDLRTMEEFYAASTLTFSTLIVRVVGGMGSMGLVLAMTGLYGLVAYSVSRRTREIGIRMAVGAEPGAIMRMVLRHGLLLAVGGTIGGVIASAALDGLLRAAFPFPHVATFDLITYLVVVPALLATTLLAASIPARRAARIDPLRAIRTD
ncbi:MAG TPA: ABC transporter permease [Vicinamibacterales bacterium]|nr:ABC transporter permease [Vicinamibacterales bacterium]